VGDSAAAVRSVMDELLPGRLLGLQRLTGLPVVFGGAASGGRGGRQLVLTRLLGTKGTSLRGLVVPAGRGLGGEVLRSAAPQRISDYATTTAITHDYDRIVVHEERLVGVLAVPVVVHGTVHGVLYGAVRDRRPIGDRALRQAGIVARVLQRDVEQRLRPAPPTAGPADALARIIGDVEDPVLRERLLAVHRELTGRPAPGPVAPPGPAVSLAPRELEVLRLVAVGAGNAEIGVRLGLSTETVKAYLRTAMRRLDVSNRTAAAHAARLAGLL
jgi:LuxR family transcriptional regulator, regulator of acetate metabolism